MRIPESCAKCLYDKQQHLTDDKEYLSEIKAIIDNRAEDDTSPYLVYQFGQVYEKRFGMRASYKAEKKKYNDLVLSMENKIREKIEESKDPLGTALAYSRAGNYIDFGAMNEVDEDTFMSLIKDVEVKDRDKEAIDSFVKQLGEAERFLLITDNCGEIVLDKLFIEQLKKHFPHLDIKTLVRGSDVLNDATMQDAEYVGIDKLAKVISNGTSVAGTVYSMITDEAREAIDHADVILAKGQGNYESMCRQGRHVFYSFLCKCELFMNRFNAAKLTGIFVEEKDAV